MSANQRERGWRIAALRIQGEIELELLKQALTELIRRQGSPPPDGALLRIFVAFDQPDREAMRDVGLALGEAPFDPGGGPLYRFAWLPLSSEDASALVMAYHSAGGEGGGCERLLAELEALLAPLSKGNLRVLPEPGLQPGSFAAWQGS